MIDRPWCCLLELSQACNIACKFCPISVLGSKEVYFTVALAERLGAQLAVLNPTARIEIAGRGEPTLCPELLGILTSLRTHVPQSHVSLLTNGVKLLKKPELVSDMFEAGLNILSIDCYHGTYAKHKKAMLAAGHAVKDHTEFSAFRKHPRGHSTQTVVLVKDIAEDQSDSTRFLNNFAGAVDPQWYAEHGPKPKVLPLKKRCVRPFRDLTVLSDGSIGFCCVDWRQQIILGDITKTTASKVWHSKKRAKLLVRLYDKDRNFAPCNKCDYFGGHRVGLVSDPRSEQ